ncbi:MAG: KdsC family phosphatase [Planctomycetota bacterium]|jgi:3-deoxy-D-manno-octulosonate 8-phosphate phosphatase (KDO 8-P phosphatase)
MTDNDLSKIQLLILDVDGVLTDGGIVVHSDGTESKRFSVLDGHRIKLWQRSGGLTAVISGRETAATTIRAKQLGISEVGLTPEQTAYVGDDLMDIPLVRRVGFGVAVANAADELKQYADFITERKGGEGAVAEVVEHLLKKKMKWEELMERYRV